MTFLGDVNQAILAHTQRGNPLQADYEGTYEKIELTKSYRSTKQIVDFTKHFSPTGKDIEPFERDGEKPQLIRYSNLNKAAEYLIDAINQSASFFEFEEDEVLIDYGQYIKSIPLLLDGAIKILREDPDMGDLLLYYLEKGDS